MGLNIKNASEILRNAISVVTHATDKITDFTIGSVSRTLLEAVSLQIEEFYFKVYDGFLYAIENSIFKAFGFELLDEQSASGDLTVEFKNALVSPLQFSAGLTFCTASGISILKYYILTADIIVPVGSTKVILPVRCTITGVDGNTPENSIVTMITANSLVSKVYNEISFTNGRSQETKAERKSRFKKYISTLVRGTSSSVEYAASTVTGITGVYVDGSSIGIVKVYCHDANGDLSLALKNSVQTAVDSYRSAGVEALILPVTKQLVNIEVNVLLNQDYDVDIYKTTISNAISTYMYQFQVNQNFYVTSLIKYLVDLDELAIVSVDVVSPSATINTTTQDLLRPGTILVNATVIE